jgi:hypothetical protein
MIKKENTELEKMSTKNLLAYYRAERMRLINWRESHYTGFEYSWHLYKEDEHLIDLLNDWYKYLQNIKNILNTREHIKRK